MRPGQTQDVVVRFFVNRNTMQEKAMSLIASKLEASLILEGELSDKGLVDFRKWETVWRWNWPGHWSGNWRLKDWKPNSEHTDLLK